MTFCVCFVIIKITPTNYLGHTLTWEKGRQLKSYDSNTYTYNANGIRTSKTVGGIAAGTSEIVSQCVTGGAEDLNLGAVALLI